MTEDSETFAGRLRAAYEHAAAAPPADAVVPDVFWYVHFKAFAFLSAGATEYRRHDALRQPPENLPEVRLHAITLGCNQIIRFRGISPDRPLEGIGVDGFYALSRLFHFAVDRQAAFETDAIGAVLDQMKLRHVVDGRELLLYNLVTLESSSRHVGNGGTCPYCGGLLRTAFAKQCRHCGRDWHDPENVIDRKKSSNL